MTDEIKNDNQEKSGEQQPSVNPSQGNQAIHAAKEAAAKAQEIAKQGISTAKKKFEEAGGVDGMKAKGKGFIASVKQGFIPDEGATGFKGFKSRVKNLWKSGLAGKVTLCAIAYFLVLILFGGNEPPSIVGSWYKSIDTATFGQHYGPADSKTGWGVYNFTSDGEVMVEGRYKVLDRTKNTISVAIERNESTVTENYIFKKGGSVFVEKDDSDERYERKGDFASKIKNDTGTSSSVEQSELSFDSIDSNCRTMTELQFEEYAEELVGKEVTWSGYVIDVEEAFLGGYKIAVSTDYPSSSGFGEDADALAEAGEEGYPDISFELPKKVAAKLSKKQSITFSGTIESISGVLQEASVDLEDVSLVE